MKTSWWQRGLKRMGLLTKAQALQMAEDRAHEAHVEARRYAAEVDSWGQPPMRGAGRTDFKRLRQLADECDAVRICIEECKAQVLATPWRIEASDEVADTGQEEREIEQAEEFLSTAGGLGGPGLSFEEFLEELLEDLLVCGCAALYRRPTKGGGLFSVEVIDAATIKPLLTPEGWVPQRGEIAFEQWVDGRKVGQGFTAEEMYYLRLSPRSNSRWGRSPTERALSAIYQYLGWDDVTLSYLRDGDAEHVIYFTPKEWTAKENLAFTEYLDSLNQTLARRQSKPLVVPDGVRKESARPRPAGVGETEQVHCLRRIAKAFGLNASVLGFAGETYKVAQGEQIRLAELSSKLPRLRIIQNLITTILRNDLGLTSVEFTFDVLASDRQVMASVIKQAGPERFTVNEARELLGQPPAEGPYADVLWTPGADGLPIILGYPKGKRPEDQAAAGQAAESASGAAAPAEAEPVAEVEAGIGGKEQEPGKAEELRRWERKALRRLREGKGAAVAFDSQVISPVEQSRIMLALQKAETPEEVKAIFRHQRAAQAAVRLATDLETLLAGVQEERGKREGWRSV